MNNCYKRIPALILVLVCIAGQAYGFDWLRAAMAGIKAYQAYTITDEEVGEYVKETVEYMDRNNKVLPAGNPYSVRLKNLTSGLKSVDGIPLNFKVYEVEDEVNAFACADGSVRVYTSLMDLMTDEELLGVIGHEIGHVGKHHSRKAIKNELLTGALRDIVASSEGSIGRLADSQLGELGEVMLNAKYSRKQESEADDYGYDFLKKNKKNPIGIVKALEKLQALDRQSSKMSRYISKLFSTHPESEERVNRLMERCVKDGYAKK